MNSDPPFEALKKFFLMLGGSFGNHHDGHLSRTLISHLLSDFFIQISQNIGGVLSEW